MHWFTSAQIIQSDVRFVFGRWLAHSSPARLDTSIRQIVPNSALFPACGARKTLGVPVGTDIAYPQPFAGGQARLRPVTRPPVSRVMIPVS